MTQEEHDHIEFTVKSQGWKLMKIEFAKRKEMYALLVMDCNLDTPEGLANAKNYQAMFHTTDAFLENVQDMLKEPIEGEDHGKSILD